MAPNCTDGPSLPSERPPSAVRVPPINLAIVAFHQLTSKYPLTSPITWGIPLPDMSGSHLTRRAVIKPIMANMQNHAMVRNRSPFTYSIVEKRMFSDVFRDNLYKDTTNPEKRPIKMASMDNLKIYFEFSTLSPRVLLIIFMLISFNYNRTIDFLFL